MKTKKIFLASSSPHLLVLCLCFTTRFTGNTDNKLVTCASILKLFVKLYKFTIKAKLASKRKSEITWLHVILVRESKRDRDTLRALLCVQMNDWIVKRNTSQATKIKHYIAKLIFQYLCCFGRHQMGSLEANWYFLLYMYNWCLCAANSDRWWSYLQLNLSSQHYQSHHL